MCFKKWFSKPTNVVPMEKVKRRLLTFGRNEYGGSNNLHGCINDSTGLALDVEAMFTDFDVRIMLDYDVTAKNYLSLGSEAISLITKDTTVLMMMDSCFSRSATKKLNAQPNTNKGRFYELGNLPLEYDREKNPIVVNVDNYIAMSACLEHETAADAYINNKYVGAFTYFARLEMKRGLTYRQWFEKISKHLPSRDFAQTPTLEGPDYLLDRMIFEDPTLIIHNSSHGTYVPDLDDDEEDTFDEALYFDRPLIDDEIRKMLSKIPN